MGFLSHGFTQYLLRGRFLTDLTDFADFLAVGGAVVEHGFSQDLFKDLHNMLRGGISRGFH